MNARDEVLDRIRRALGSTVQPEVNVPRAYRGAAAGPTDTAQAVDLLMDRLVDYRAVVSRCGSDEVSQIIDGILTRRGAHRVMVPTGFPDQWLPTTVGLVSDDPPLSPGELDLIDGVLSTTAVAIAETGTVVLDAGPGQGRRALSLIPDLHIAVVRGADVVRGVPDALTRLDATRPMTWISGPSATSDIELSRVEGVHGPRRLEVVIVV